MAQNIIGFFCGTGYYTEGDASREERRDDSLQAIRRHVEKPYTLLAYDGCQVHGGGLFAYGVEEQADAFIADLKQNLNPDEETYQINFVAHSRGVLSALLAIKKIQADTELRDKVKVTCDFRDPVPGNFQITTKIAGDLASANQLHDLTHCDIVKKVSITLQEFPIIPMAFDALIPKFHHATELDIETLPGYHDAQQRQDIVSFDYEHAGLSYLGDAKTLSILETDGFTISPQFTQQRSLKEQQLLAYQLLTEWAIDRLDPFEERDLHFGGQIIANNPGKAALDVINWRHAKLADITPTHVLYGTTQPDYNYKKSLLEHACDVMQTLDKFAANNPGHMELVTNLRDLTKAVSKEQISMKYYKTRCNQFLKDASVTDASINKAVNYLCMMNYFKKFDKAMADWIDSEDSLFESLHELKVSLLEELTVNIESGKTIDQIDQSNAVKIASNTADYLNTVCNDARNAEEVIRLSENYANDNIRLGRNWHLGSKIITGAIMAIAATVVGCVIGAALGFGIGFACGLATGPAALISACVGAFVGGLAGAVTGIYGANHFFKASPVEKQIQTISNMMKAGITVQENDSFNSTSLQPSMA